MARIIGAPGYEDFDATVIPGLGRLPVDDDREYVAVVVDRFGEQYVVPSSAVRQPENERVERYLDEWQAKTGRARSDIYIPEALGAVQESMDRRG